jgi:hypothetical protein
VPSNPVLNAFLVCLLGQRIPLSLNGEKGVVVFCDDLLKLLSMSVSLPKVLVFKIGEVAATVWESRLACLHELGWGRAVEGQRPFLLR